MPKDDCKSMVAVNPVCGIVHTSNPPMMDTMNKITDMIVANRLLTSPDLTAKSINEVRSGSMIKKRINMKLSNKVNN